MGKLNCWESNPKARIKRQSFSKVKGWFLFILLVFIVIWVIPSQKEKVEPSKSIIRGSTQDKLPKNASSILKERLYYLDDIEEVSWVKFHRNFVYIGFKTISPDICLIIAGAALQGNIALNYDTNVTAVNYKFKKRPLEGYICSAIARHGWVRQNNCQCK